MPRQTEPSDGPSSLPAPELNPLLNPVLGQNMGRWAEAYFTSPPEKREQAVLELLRELRAENPTGGEGIATSANSGQEQASESLIAPASQAAEVAQVEVPPPPVPCPACGRENPASHRFCGMCGRPVAGRGAAADLPVADLSVSDLQITDLHVADLPVSDLQITDLHIAAAHITDRPIEDPHADETARRAQRNESQYVLPEDAPNEPAARTNDFPFFRSGSDLFHRDDRSDELVHDPPASRSYRVYVGIALAAVILALAYMAWRSTQATSQNAQGEPLASSVATAQQAAPAPVPASTSTAEIPDRTPPSQQTAIPPQTAPESAPVQAAPPTTPATEETLRPDTAAGNGAEEVAIAQRYLSGTDGQEPNRVEAAKWLWKAVAKHNGEATILLSDLYLRGEGVGKNCDQARVLLDAAARQGVKDAGERLRHLQAFGCQ